MLYLFCQLCFVSSSGRDPHGVSIPDLGELQEIGTKSIQISIYSREQRNAGLLFMLPASCGNTILCFYQFQMVQIQTEGFPGLEDLPVRYVIFLWVPR